MDVLFNVPNRNLSNTTLSSGLVLVNNITPIESCGNLLLRYDVTNVSAGESLRLTYSLYKGGEFRLGSETLITASGPGSVGFNIGDKDATTQVKFDIVVVGSVRVSCTLYALGIGEDVL